MSCSSLTLRVSIEVYPEEYEKFRSLTFLQRLAPDFRNRIEGRQVGLFQGHGNVFLRRQENRQVGQLVADGHRVDKGFRSQPGKIRGAGKGYGPVESKSVAGTISPDDG